MIRAIVGANWGDEGKGKMTDVMASEADIVIRYQGGSNAGHTIINDHGKFALHLLPSGILSEGVTNILGPGVALDIPALQKELAEIQGRGVSTGRLLVSDRAQVLLPVHRDLDALEEQRLGKQGFGSTKSGIAPFYSDKYAKIGFQVCELYDGELLSRKVKLFCDRKNVLLKHLYNAPELVPDELIAYLLELGGIIRPYVCDVTAYLHDAVAQNKNILLEGQLGALRDPDHGIYPFVTSSSPLAGFATVGAGLPPASITSVLAVVKAYSSCVGAGPFVTELFGQEAQELRSRGGDCGEYGATTGRPRRMGYFDAVATRYGCRVQGADEIALTLLDVLGYMAEIPVCTGYRIGGKVTGDFPATPLLDRAEPVYKTMPGWQTDIRGCRDYALLPDNAKRYVDFVEKEAGIPVTWVSNGPKRKEILRRPV